MELVTCVSRAAGVALAALTLASAAQAQAPSHWVGSWASAQQTPDGANALAPGVLDDATLRQVVHLSIGGSAVRVRLSNAFGTQQVEIDSIHLARAKAPGSAAIVAGTDHAVTFAGQTRVTIPANAEYWSDPIALPASAGADLAVSFHLRTAPQGQTSHPGAHATGYVVHGEQTTAADLQEAQKFDHWFLLSGVDVRSSGHAVIAFGDSITDGHASTTDGDDRWPDDLAQRLNAAGHVVGVLNLGIGGNHILTDGIGPNAMSRFDRDVLAQSGARTVILMEGINDLGTISRDLPTVGPEVHAALLQKLYTADTLFIAKAHEHGLKVIGATLTPYVGSDYYHPAAANEADREALNAWIRAPGRFDAVIDFDHALADPAHPHQMLAAYDSGDHLHPSPAGYHAMAASIPLTLLSK